MGIRAVKKSALYRSLWESCDELRGGMDASQYKDYVLTMLFIKYVSDKYAGQKRGEVMVPSGATFQDMVDLKGKPDIGDQINKKIIAPLEKENNLSGMPDFNDDAKLGSGNAKKERLTKLITVFEKKELNFTANRAEDDDLLGDAYEYLMRHFASESGKSKGQFYTPAEVSRLIAQILLSFPSAPVRNTTTFYDPTCGSGSLLLKICAEADDKGSLFGQEKDFSTATLARMNMILHNMATAEIEPGNTLAEPKFVNGSALRTFDYVVANPPFSDKSWSTGVDPENDRYGRFEFGMPPPKRGDYAYLLHIVSSLKSRGKGACILPHGVLFRGNAEAHIRENLLERGYIRGIVGLPPNLFYGTGIPGCIVLLDKENADPRRGVFFVDASAGFAKDEDKNRLREMDIRRIADAITNAPAKIPGYARMVSRREIAANGFNLNIPRYIDNCPPEDMQDIDAHLHGGIPVTALDTLEKEHKFFAKLRKRIFVPLRKGYITPSVLPAKITTAISESPEFKTFEKNMNTRFRKWRTTQTPKLRVLKKRCSTKKIIADLGESILSYYKKTPLIDNYRAYQNLMEFWEHTMQDDCYLIAVDGWMARPEPVSDKGKEMGWECGLVPKCLVEARYFSGDRAKLNAQIAKEKEATSHRVALEKEHSNDDGLFSRLGKINRQNVQARLKETADAHAVDFAEEKKMLCKWQMLADKESDARRVVKLARSALDKKVLAHYNTLTEEEVKTLVVDDKWLAELAERMRGEVKRTGYVFCRRLQALCERYETPLSELTANVTDFDSKVKAHLRHMGFAGK